MRLKKAISKKTVNTVNMVESQRCCPCCGRIINGTVKDEKTRFAVKTGTKLLVKTGSKELLGGGATSVGATLGATIGSVVTVVGTAIGAFVGGAAGHILADKALDKAYDSLEDEFCPKTYIYCCNQCNLTWTSNDIDDRQIIIDKYRSKYYRLSLKDPEPPTKNVDKSDAIDTSFYWVILLCFLPLICLLMLHFLSYMAYIFTFTLWDPTDTTWGYITSFGIKAIIGSLALFFLVGLYYIYKKISLVINYNREMKKYKDICKSNREFNLELHSRLLNELNSILERKHMRLENSLDYSIGL